MRRERRSSVGGESEYAFRHLLVRDVAYGQIPRGGRAERHERAAAWIESLGRREDHAEMLAHHYLEALRLRRAAGQAESAAARRAARAARPGTPATGRSRSARFPPPRASTRRRSSCGQQTTGDRPQLLLAYGRSRIDDAGLDESLLEQARDGLLPPATPRRRPKPRRWIGTIWLNRGDRDAALEHLKSARRMLDDRRPSPEKAFVLQELSRMLMMGEDLERSIEVGSESLAWPRSSGSAPCVPAT